MINTLFEVNHDKILRLFVGGMFEDEEWVRNLPLRKLAERLFHLTVCSKRESQNAIDSSELFRNRVIFTILLAVDFSHIKKSKYLCDSRHPWVELLDSEEVHI